MKYIYVCVLGLLFMLSPVFGATSDPLEGVCGRRAMYNQDSTNLQWKVDTLARTLTITGKGRMRDYDLDTKAPWYPWRNRIEKAIFPNGMTTVGEYAMYNLSQMSDLQWGGNTVKTIYKYAFSGCSLLPELSLPDAVTYIGERAFEKCSSIKSLKMGANVSTIIQYAFHNCSQIETIDFGNSPAEIGAQAFSPARSLVSIKSKRIKIIGAQAFEQCTKLVDLQFGDSLIRIYDQAFFNCNSLQKIHFPATLQSFYASCFRYCDALDVITVDPKNPLYDSRNNCNAVMLTSNNTLVFGCCKTVIPTETQAIGDNAFYACKRLETLVLPEGVQSLGANAFYNCEQLKTVKLPESVTSVGCEVFYGCKNLSAPIYNSMLFVQLHPSFEGAYTIPGTPQIIACGAFENCDGLTSVSIPSSVGTISSMAFKQCDNLQSVPLPAGLTYLGPEAFSECKILPSISIPQGVKYINPYTFYRCFELNSVTLPPNLEVIDSYSFWACTSLPSVVIPDAVTRIRNNAFENCTSLTTITLPANLNNFGARFLSGCTSLREIIWNVRICSNFSIEPASSDPFDGIRAQITGFTFGDSVRAIPSNLCYNMTNLTSLSLGCNIETIGSNAFYGCNRIKSIYWNLRTCSDPQIYTSSPFYSLRDSVTTFTFGDSVRHIPAYLCHSMNRLPQIHIPANVTSIGDYAFRYVNALDSISVDTDNSYYDSRNHCNALIDTDSDVLLLGCYKTHFPEDIAGIGECAFRNVRKLTSVELPENVTFVGPEAFNGCLDLKDLTFSNRIKIIDDYAFQDCDSLTTLIMPEDLSNVGFRAFANCTQLESVTLNRSTPPAIDPTSFSNTTCPFQVPCAAIPTYRQAPVWSDFGSRVTGQALFTLTVKQNDYGFGKTTIVQQPNCERPAIVEAEPARGYDFISWQNEAGNVLSTDLRYEFPLEEDMIIIAFFKRRAQGFAEVLQDNAAIWYDIMGHRVSQPTSGVYIVQKGTETYKVMIP